MSGQKVVGLTTWQCAVRGLERTGSGVFCSGRGNQETGHGEQGIIVYWTLILGGAPSAERALALCIPTRDFSPFGPFHLSLLVSRDRDRGGKGQAAGFSRPADAFACLGACASLTRSDARSRSRGFGATQRRWPKGLSACSARETNNVL